MANIIHFFSVTSLLNKSLNKSLFDQNTVITIILWNIITIKKLFIF